MERLLETYSEMTKKTVIAIDPGASGAIAWRNHLGERYVVNMPDTPMGILAQIRKICDEEDEYGVIYPNSEYVCYLEDVGHGLPGQSSSATAKFGRHNGHLEMALYAEGIKMVKVTPQKWEKSFALGKSSEYSKSDWKRRLKQRAEELYPQFKVTLKNSDALLMLNYAEKCESIVS